MSNGRISFVAIVCCLSSFGVSFTSAVHAEHFNILMIGNSYTQGNATARATSLDVQGLFDADPDYSANVTVRADSSASLQDHVNNPATTSLITNPANHWDVIVLQERSERPALAMKHGGSELTGLNKGGPVLISKYIKPFQPQASVVLFNTWARALDSQDLIDDFDNNPAEMLAYTNQGYDRIRKNLPSWDYSDVTTIARVGDAWDDWYGTYGYGGSAGLHLSDGTHQNNRGAYLAASVIFETITGKSTVGNTYTGAVTGNISGASQVMLLQQRATDVTNATAGMPGDYNRDGIVDAADYLVWRHTFGSPTSLPGDNTAGVGADDYDRWRMHFGNASDGRGFAAVSVPEPMAANCAVMAVLVVTSQSRVRRRPR
jgi:uncharacterized protein DUF4886